MNGKDKPPRILYVSGVLTLLALALMVWSVLAPTPLPVMLAMTVGQFLGTIAFGLYLLVVVKDLRTELRANRAKRESLRDMSKIAAEVARKSTSEPDPKPELDPKPATAVATGDTP